MMVLALTILTALSQIKPASALTGLTCQRFSCNGPNGMQTCPDSNTQSQSMTGSAGGNVFITIVQGQHLIDKDSMVERQPLGHTTDGAVARWSDTYVRVKVGIDGQWSTQETNRVGNKKYPKWNETLAMGWHRAGEAQVVLQVLDYDTGVEVVDGGDDVLGNVRFRLPFCSSLETDYADLVCDDKGCKVPGSSWAAKGSKLCREEGWLPLGNGYYTGSAAEQDCCEITQRPCIYVIIQVVPFQAYIEEATEPFVTTLFADARTKSAGILPASSFGWPYIDNITEYRLIDSKSPLNASGALLLQTMSSVSQRSCDLGYARVSINAEATLTLCRPADCYTIPPWLWDWEYVMPIPIMKQDHYIGYTCHQRFFTPRTGSGLSTITLGWPCCEKNYFVVVEPHFGTSSKVNRWQVHFERIELIVRSVQFGVPLMIFLPGLTRLLVLCRFHVARPAMHLFSIGKDFIVEKRHGVSALPFFLFLGDGSSKNNREFRHNLYWASRCVFFLGAMACSTLWACGVVIATTVRPARIGLCIVFMGTGALSLSCGLSRWRHEQWRLTQHSCIGITLSMGCVWAYSLLATINDYASNTDFMALTMVFLGLGIAPLALEIIEFSSNLEQSRGMLVLSLAAAARSVESKLIGSKRGNYWLLKECHSASSDLPDFDFVPDVAGNLCGLNNKMNSMEMAALRRAILRTVARLTLLAYIVGVFILTTRGYLALAFVILLITIDIVHYCLDCGSVKWSPSRTICLVTGARAVIVFGGERRWIIGFSVIYSVYGSLILIAIVDKYLPYLSHQEACEQAFHVDSTTCRSLTSARFNVAGEPEFALLLMTGAFFVIVVVVSYTEPQGVPLPLLNISTTAQLPASTCSIIALLLVAFYGSAHGFVRAASLESQNLLLGGTASAYLMFRCFNLSKMLAAFSYVCLLVAGLLLWGELQAPAAFAVLALGPLCILCFICSCHTWLVNDCRLVAWPPCTVNITEKENVSDVGLAFGMLQAMIGESSKNRRDSCTMETPQLLGETGEEEERNSIAINMPMLPPKSTMTQRVVYNSRTKDRRHAGVPRTSAPRRQMIDLGLHACRINKQRRLAANPRKKGNSDLPLPNLTLKEISDHLAKVLLQQIARNFLKSKTNNVETNLKHLSSIQVLTDDSLMDPIWGHIPLWEALLTGCLLKEEYRALVHATAVPLLFITLGGLLALCAHPPCVVGHLLWTLSTSVCLTMCVMFKWFKTYKIALDMIYLSVFGWLIYVGVLAWTFYAWLDSHIDVAEVMWLLNALFIYPVGLFALYRLVGWIDRGYKASVTLSQDAYMSTATFACRRLANGTMCLVLLIQIYLWGSRYAALVCLFLLLGARTTLPVVCTWAMNEFYLPPALVRKLHLVFLAASIITMMMFLALRGTPAIVMLSLFFVLHLLKCIIRIVTLVSHHNTDDLCWFSPTVLPAYSYSTEKCQLLNETPLIISCGALFCVGISWGATLVCFSEHIFPGICIVYVFVSCGVIFVTAACAHVPEKLGIAAAYLPVNTFVDAAESARKKFVSALHAGVSKYEVSCEEDNAASEAGNKKAAPANEASNDGMEPNFITQGGQLQEIATLGSSARGIAMDIAAANRAFRLAYFDNETLAWRADALYTDLDGIAETCACRGPFSYLGILLRFWQLVPPFSTLWRFDSEGTRIYAQEAIELEAGQEIRQLDELYTSFQRRFNHELKALASFHLFVLAGAATHLSYEKIRFQTFLREKRFKLLSNGVAPPHEIFDTFSFAVLNVQLVASWLESLGEDQRERFHLLQENFKTEQSDYQAKRDQHDLNEVLAATKLAHSRLEREHEMYVKRAEECSIRRSRRMKKWVSCLNTDEQHRFIHLLQGQSKCDAISSSKLADEPLRRSYQLHVLHNNEETVGNCRERLAELEAGEVDCYPSKVRKGALQFIDPKFRSGPGALGACRGGVFVGHWEHALSVNPHAILFSDSIDPDDIYPGACVDNSWFLATLSMLSAAGDTGDGGVDTRIKQLFINMVDPEGNVVYDSAVGAFGLKIFCNGQWEATIVDDSLPMLGDGTNKSGVDSLIALDLQEREQFLSVLYSPQLKDESIVPDELYKKRYKDCAGFAVSHTLEMTELWVSLLEKGVAKYYGSYANIEAGFVHQGLELLTGNHAECSHIAKASRGIGRHTLWGSLLRYYKNEYIIGAGAVPAEYASSLLQGSGLLFGATYTIYDIVNLAPEGHKLVKLRNPAGHLEIYKGTWSHSSPRWTKRLRFKLLADLEPSSFWMSFDEFCCAFRCIYVCRYFAEDSTIWKRLTFSGEWTCTQQISASASNQENTAAGLPSRYNPGCEVGRNPQYALYVHRPISLRVSLRQTTTNGDISACVLPVAGYLCQAGWYQPGDNKRIDRITKLDNQNIVATTGQARYQREVDIYVDRLDPGAYCILVGTFQAEMQGHFTLSLISNHEIQASQIWPPSWRVPSAVENHGSKTM